MAEIQDQSISLDIRLTYLEDQVNKMNLILAQQARKIDALNDNLNRVGGRLAFFEKLLQSDTDDMISPVGDFTTSDNPPDGANR